MRIFSSKFRSLEDIPSLALSIGSEIVRTAAGVIEVDIILLYTPILPLIALRADAAGPNNSHAS